MDRALEDCRVFYFASVEDKAALDQYIGHGTPMRVEIQTGRINADTATYRISKHFKDVSMQPAIVELFRDRIDGKWKTAWASPTL